MDADLCRLLGRVFNSPYWKTKVMGTEAPTSEGGPVEDWVMAQCEQAGTFDSLDSNIQRVLKMCDRSFELFQENLNSTEDPDTLNAKIVAQVDKEYASH